MVIHSIGRANEGNHLAARPARSTPDTGGREFDRCRRGRRPRCTNWCTNLREEGDYGGHRRPSGEKSALAKKPTISRVSRVIPAKEEKRAKGLEPSTSSLGSSVPVVLRAGNTAFSSAGADGCTGGCTETDNRAEIIARAVELVAALNLSITESVNVLHLLLRPPAEVVDCPASVHSEAALPPQASRTA